MKQTLALGLLAAVQLLGQLLLQIYVIRIFGINSLTDAFFAAQALPLVISGILISTLQSVWLPKFSQSTGKQLRERLRIAQGQAIVLAGFIITILATTVWLWVPLLFPGFTSYQILTTTKFTFYFLVSSLFSILASVLIFQLRSASHFLLADAIPTLITLLCFFLMLAFLDKNITYALIILGFRSLATYTCLMYVLRWPFPNFKSCMKFENTLELTKPQLIGTSVYKTMPIVDRYWASLGNIGSIVTINASQSIMTAMVTVFEKALCIPVIPNFSRLVLQKKYLSLQRGYRLSLLKILATSILITLVMYFFDSKIGLLIQFLLKVTPAQSEAIVSGCFFFTGYLFSALSGIVLVSVFYALEDTLSPIIIGLIGFSIGLLLKYYLFTMFSINGLIASTSIYMLINVVVFFIVIEYKLNQLKERNEF